MRHKKKGNPLNRTGSHRKAMLGNLVTAMIDKGKIRTTHAKAKEGQRLTEKMVTLGKRNTLHARRQAVALLHDKGIVKKLFNEIAPLYAERPGGYTRVVKLGMRKGDGAMLSQLEFVGDGITRGRGVTGDKAAAAGPKEGKEAKAAAPAKEKVARKKAPAKKKEKEKDTEG